MVILSCLFVSYLVSINHSVPNFFKRRIAEHLQMQGIFYFGIIMGGQVASKYNKKEQPIARRSVYKSNGLWGWKVVGSVNGCRASNLLHEAVVLRCPIRWMWSIFEKKIWSKESFVVPGCLFYGGSESCKMAGNLVCA